MSIFRKSNDKRHKTGSFGEEAAALFLQKKGYKIIETNYHNSRGRQLGEIDIIATDKKTLVFAEVKTRTISKNTNAFPAEANITRDKLHKLNKIAQAYLKYKNLWDSPFRFDAISVYVDKDSREIAKICHICDIFF